MRDDITGKERPRKAPFHDLPSALDPLRALPHWIVWRYELNNNNKWTKVPYQAHRPKAKASSKDKSTWSDYDSAVQTYQTRDDIDGIGFVLTETEIAAFDLDDCRDPTTNAIEPWAQNIIERAASYTEVTASGTGLRIIGYGQDPEVHRKQANGSGSIETYRRATRYIAMTGETFNTLGLANIDKVIDDVVAELDAKKKKAPKGEQTRERQVKDLPRDLGTMLLVPDPGAGEPVGDYPTRSEFLIGFINKALRALVDEASIVAACIDNKYVGKAIYEHVHDGGGEDYIKLQIEHALNKSPTPEHGPQFVRIVEGELHKTWRKTEQALIVANCPVYVRGGKLVQPLWRWEKEKNSEVLTAQFVRYNVARLADVTAHHAVQFQKYDGRSQGFRNIDPPGKLIEALIEAGHWAFPTGIVNSPTMRPDGSLLTEPGYDPATQLWYKPSSDVNLPPIPEHPTKDDGEKSLASLNRAPRKIPFAKSPRI